jgi:hypothetical protein
MFDSLVFLLWGKKLQMQKNSEQSMQKKQLFLHSDEEEKKMFVLKHHVQKKNAKIVSRFTHRLFIALKKNSFFAFCVDFLLLYEK